MNVCRVKYQFGIMTFSGLPVISVSTLVEDGMRQVTLILQDEMIIFINNDLRNKGHSMEFV